jgi:hypothetical protein
MLASTTPAGGGTLAAPSHGVAALADFLREGVRLVGILHRPALRNGKPLSSNRALVRTIEVEQRFVAGFLADRAPPRAMPQPEPNAHKLSVKPRLRG